MIYYLFTLIILFIISTPTLINCQQLPQSQKNSIDQLKTLYNLNEPINLDYCGYPQYFICDKTNITITKIFLIGDINSKQQFPDGIINIFINMTTISLTNSIISPTFFSNIPSSLVNLTLDTCTLDTFPTSINNIKSLYMNDIPFNGNIQMDTISTLSTFFLTYSSSNNMNFYNFTEGIITSGDSAYNSNFKITINNLINMSKSKHYLSIQFILGKYFFDTSLSLLSNTSATTCSIQDIGHFNQELSFNPIYPIESIQTLSFNNIKFNLGSDQSIMDFKNSKISTLVINACTGLINSTQDIKIQLDKIKFFDFTNNNLVKFPDVTFYNNLLLLDVSNNKLTSGPILIEPTVQEDVKTMDLSNNLITGTVPDIYCYHYITITNNQFSGTLPSCFICSLVDSTLRSTIDGNIFTNYQTGMASSQFPPCTGISFTNKTEFSVSSSSLVFGTNLGWSSLNPLYIPYTTSSTPNFSLIIIVPNKIMRTGSGSSALLDQLIASNYKAQVKFLLSGINATLEFEIARPTIDSIVVAPYSNQGYSFFFYGNGYPISTDQAPMIAITVGDFKCSIVSSYGNNLRCIVFESQMAEKDYIIIVKNLKTGLTNAPYTFKFERTFPYITSINSPNSTGGQVILYGSYGPNVTIAGVSLLIGSSPCIITSVASDVITCNIGAGSGVQNVTLIDQGTTWQGYNIFRYKDQSLPCPSTSSGGVCNGKGVCEIDGTCVCTSGYFGGPKCELLFEEDATVVRNELLTEIIKNGYSFGFSIRDIIEVDFNGNIARRYNFTSWNITLDSTIHRWTYTNKVSENTMVSYTVEQIVGQPKNFTFAGVTSTLQPGQLKLSANISNWEYMGSLNTLQLQIQSSVKAQADTNDECSSEINSVDNGISLNYITIQKDNNVLTGRFIDKVESDGKVTFSKVAVTEQSSNSITVSLKLPFCKECIIDPDFSVLISPDSTTCGNSNSRLKWIIPVSIILGLLFIAGVILGILYIARNKLYFSKRAGIVFLRSTNTKKSKSDSNSNSLN